MSAEEERRPPSRGWIGLLVGVAAVVYLYRSIALPLLLAALVAYLLGPVVVFFAARGIRRGVTVTALFLVAVGVAAFAVWRVAPIVQREASEALGDLPAFSQRIEARVDRTLDQLRREQPTLGGLLPERSPGWTTRWLERQKESVGEIAGKAGEAFTIVLLAPIFAFFLLRDGSRWLDWLVDQLAPEHIETTVAVWCEIDRIVGRYLRGLLIESLVVGTLAALGLWVIGVPVPLLLGLFTALVNPIPYVGALASVVVASLVALGAGNPIQTVFAIVVLFLAIRLVDDVVVVPLTVGGSVHLHPALVIASILAGEHLLGVLGMVLAVLTVTIVKEIVRLLLQHRRKLARTARPPARRGAPHLAYLC